MKRLQFTESEETQEQKEALVESTKEALFELAKLEDHFSGLAELTEEEIEAIAQKIFAEATADDLFLLQKPSEDVVGLCGLVSKFTQRVSASMRHQNSAQAIPHFESFSSQAPAVKSESKLVYRGVRIDKLRALLGFYLLASQPNDEPAFDSLMQKLAHEELFTLELVKSEPAHENHGSHYWQLRKFTTELIKNHIREQPDFQAGIKVLASLAQTKREQPPLEPRYWQQKISEKVCPPRTPSEEEIIADRYEAAKNKIIDPTIELPSESELRNLFGFDENVDIKRTLSPLAQAMGVSKDIYQSDSYWDGVIEYIQTFVEDEKITNEDTLECDSSHLSFKIIFAEFVFWLESESRELERAKKG